MFGIVPKTYYSHEETYFVRGAKRDRVQNSHPDGMSKSELVFSKEGNTMYKEVTPYDGKHDTELSKPYIDCDEWREVPVRHRYIHGGFEGSTSRFCFYFPEKKSYLGRFYQLLLPMQGPETFGQEMRGEEDIISFCIHHGAFFVMTNLGANEPVIGEVVDGSIAYRCSAQSAIFARKLADEMYGEQRHYGYIFGGSGGAFKTISAAESTVGIWDGAFPHVLGSPMALPNVFTVRAHAMRILRNKLEEIKDALEPGGSGDPYACLNEEQAAALREAELMGFPMPTWCVYDTIGAGALPVLLPTIPAIDATYYSDFWTKEGYLGFDPTGSAVRDRVRFVARVKEVLPPESILTGIAEGIEEGNAYGVDEAWKNAFGKSEALPLLVLEEADIPAPESEKVGKVGIPSLKAFAGWDDPYTQGLKFHFLSGALKGEVMDAAWLRDTIFTSVADVTGRNLAELLSQVQPGDEVMLENSDYIAIQTFHRHQVPGPEFKAWDQFRDQEGKPIYPQRPVLTGPIFQLGGSGSIQTGKLMIPTIVLESHMDESAFPWQADYYRYQVMNETGSDAPFRLYIMEHCMHTDCQEGNGGDHQHVVSYVGARNQILLMLSDWVERGILPDENTGYRMDGGKVILADTAAERKGLQPVVKLKANGSERVEIKAGETVSFIVEVELPEGSGNAEEFNWSFEGEEQFAPAGNIISAVWNEDGTGLVAFQAEHAFDKPGTYFPVVKVATNKNPGDFYTRIRNQARVRVIVV